MRLCKAVAIGLMLMIPVACKAETLSDKGYYAVVLQRRDAIQGRSIDAVIFTRTGGKYRFIRRLDEDYRLIVNATSGVQAPEVTTGNSQSYDEMIKGNHLVARTIRDKNGGELAIVYCGLNPCYIDRQIRQDGSVLFDIKGSMYEERAHFFMAEAIKEARKGLRQGGIPIGAVLVRNGRILARGHNRRVQKGSPILHAEMDCFANAGRISAAGYRNCVLYSTLSPCDMCAGAALLFRIPTIVIGENVTFKGPEGYLKKRGVRVIDLDSLECAEMMRTFISRNRKIWREDISI